MTLGRYVAGSLDGVLWRSSLAAFLSFGDLFYDLSFAIFSLCDVYLRDLRDLCGFKVLLCRQKDFGAKIAKKRPPRPERKN
jgi:hypothetical protein